MRTGLSLSRAQVDAASMMRKPTLMVAQHQAVGAFLEIIPADLA
jgi:hypothetical protein